MGKTFRTREGKSFEVERETKTLKLIKVENTDYYKGKNHDEFLFKDSDGTYYYYDAALNADMTEYDTKFASELACEEGKYVTLSAYFVPRSSEKSYYTYLPRLLKIEE